MHRVLSVLLMMAGILVPPSSAFQLQGRFYLSKDKFSAGEPVYLIFEVENNSNQPVTIRTADPLSFCGGYKIEMSQPRPKNRMDVLGAGAAVVPAARKPCRRAGSISTGFFLIVHTNCAHREVTPCMYPTNFHTS